jgi:hypothetical protein
MMKILYMGLVGRPRSGIHDASLCDSGLQTTKRLRLGLRMGPVMDRDGANDGLTLPCQLSRRLEK